MSIPKPICAVCNREVEALQTDYDLLRDETIFTVRCHGAVERAAVEKELFSTLMGFRVGRAFSTAALAAAAKLLTEK